MKAIIMAGGEGSRLRPLTCDCPKPMLRLMGRPLMEYAMQLLQKHGIHEIGATLGYLPDAIMDYFGDGEDFEAQLHYYIERTPLGTAGSVKQAEEFLNEPFIVLSGDGITDIDLSKAIRFHREKGALATLVLQKSAHPQEYGMVVTDKDGRIRSFHEKPGKSDVYSELINTGIYILEPTILKHIPENKPYDFGHELFPALLQKGAPVYGYVAPGYWCDVGDVTAYLRVHTDALDGKIDLEGLKPCTDGAILEAGCTIETPVFIAPGAHICAGSRIGPYSVISDNCFIAPEAGIKRSLLLSGSRIETNAQLRGCIVGTNAIVGAGAQLFEESVVGSNSQIGERSILSPGVKLWPEKSLPGGEKPEANIVWGRLRQQRFIAGKLQIESPAQATRAAEACAAQLQSRELVLGRSASCVANALWHAAAAGAMAQGVKVLDAGICTLPQLRHTLQLLHADAAMLVDEDGLTPLDSHGTCLTERRERDVLKLLERQDFSGPFTAITHPLSTGCSTFAPYIADTAAMFESDPACARQIILCAEGHLLELAKQAFIRAGLTTRSVCTLEELQPKENEIGIYLPGSGETALLCDAEGMLSEVQRQLACAWTALEMGQRQLILPVHATRAIDALAQHYGAQTRYLAGENALWMKTLAQESKTQFQLQFDGLSFALRFVSLLTDKNLSLAHWRQSVPDAFRSMRGVQVPSGECGRLLHRIAEDEKNAQMGGGLRLKRSNGWVWLGLDEREGLLNIISEAANMETSREICDFYDDKIARLLAAQD